MFDLTTLFISKAWAQDAAAPVADAVGGAAVQGPESALMRFVPFFLILAVFYAFVLRPQQKKAEAQEKMQSGIKKGDKVLTTSGIVGTITKVVDDHYVRVEIAKDVEIKMSKDNIAGPLDDKVEANQNK
ncbi:MAG: preprotein translocase subunit YajC [Bdellovibrionales bacterium]